MKKFILISTLILLLCGCAEKKNEEISQENSVLPQENISENVLKENSQPTVSEQLFKDNFEIFEKYFMGTWIDVKNSNFNTSLNMNYSEDGLFRGMQNCIGMYEDEKNAYILFLGGGGGQLFQIEKSQPNLMYFYSDWNSNPEYSSAYKPEIYTYIGGRETFAKDWENIRELSLLGREKLQADFGITLSKIGENLTLDDGTQWEAVWSMDLPLEKFSLAETPTENKIVFVRQLSRLGTEGNPRQNIKITAEKLENEWKISKAEVLK